MTGDASASGTLRRRLASFFKGPRNALRYALSPMGREADLLAVLEGRTVALVGNARSFSGGSGAEIDGHDLVVRFNKAPIPDTRSHGSRTDWIVAGAAVDPGLVAARGARTVLWATKLRKLPGWMYGQGSVVLYPRRRERALRRRLGAVPSSGMMAVELLARSRCRAVTLYGFDFFRSLSLSGHRSREEVPHDFDRERELILDLIERDRRFRLATPHPDGGPGHE